MTVVGFVVTALFVPLLLSEFGDWCPWLARRMVRWAANHLGDRTVAERYEEEWLADLSEIPGKLACLAVAVSYLIWLPRMRWSIDREALSTRSPIVESSLLDFLGRYIPEYFSKDQKSGVTELAVQIINDAREGVRNCRYAIAGPIGSGKTTMAGALAQIAEDNGIPLAVAYGWSGSLVPEEHGRLDGELAENTLFIVDEADATTPQLIDQLNPRCSVLITTRCATLAEVPENCRVIRIPLDMSFLRSEWMLADCTWSTGLSPVRSSTDPSRSQRP
jgi:hypothetical protein